MNTSNTSILRYYYILILAYGCCFFEANAQQPVLPEHKGVILWLENGVQITALSTAIADHPWETAPKMKALGFNLFKMDCTPSQTAYALEVLKMQTGVRYAGPNRKATLRNIGPNDPFYANQWHHAMLGSERAWDISTGGVTPEGHRIVVAIMDAGFERDHEDIQGNLWVNPGEIPNDGLDNDNNGFIDDYNGYNPKLNNGDLPLHNHGQSVSGYVGAKGNNGLGISGFSWDVEMMLIAPTLFEDDVASGLNFVYEWRRKFNQSQGMEGAYIPVVNMSLGFDTLFPGDLPWMCPVMELLHQEGVIVVAAAPNEGVDIGLVGDLPCLCPSPNMICVTSTTQDDDLVSNAGFSKNFVHLSAPGYQSYTTKLSTAGVYGIFSGTSAAAPMVSGVIGLLASMPCQEIQDSRFQNPSLAAYFFKNAILQGSIPVKDLKDITITGGRLSVWSDKNIGAVPSFSNSCGSAEGPIGIMDIRPNPANDEALIILRSPGNTRIPVRVYNVLGEVLWERNYEPESFEPKFVTIPVADWAAGVYFVAVGNGKALTTKKLLILH